MLQLIRPSWVVLPADVAVHSAVGGLVVDVAVHSDIVGLVDDIAIQLVVEGLVGDVAVHSVVAVKQRCLGEALSHLVDVELVSDFVVDPRCSSAVVCGAGVFKLREARTARVARKY